jgi:hypothetical protein
MTHRRYLENPIAKPKREDFGLSDKCVFPETQYESIAKISTDYVEHDRKDEFVGEAVHFFDTELPLLLRKYVNHDIVHVLVDEVKRGQAGYLRSLASISSIYLKEEWHDAAQKELRFIGAMKDWKRYESWKNGRNAKRQAMEAKCGFDSKHGMHLIRLQAMSVEILEGKGILVDRTGIDREMLMEIRNGEWRLDQVMDLSNSLEAKAQSLYETTKIPREPARDKIMGIVLDILKTYPEW